MRERRAGAAQPGTGVFVTAFRTPLLTQTPSHRQQQHRQESFGLANTLPLKNPFIAGARDEFAPPSWCQQCVEHWWPEVSSALQQIKSCPHITPVLVVYLGHNISPAHVVKGCSVKWSRVCELSSKAAFKYSEFLWQDGNKVVSPFQRITSAHCGRQVSKNYGVVWVGRDLKVILV